MDGRSSGGLAVVSVLADDAAWSRPVADRLELDGYVVQLGEAAASVPCAVAVVELSWMLDRQVLGHHVRPVAAASMLVVAPPQASEQALLAAFDGGADQVVREPVRPHEVAARVRSLLRRVPPPASDPTRVPPDDGEWPVLDAPTGVAMVGGSKVHLTSTEAAVLQLLLERRGGVAARPELLARCVPARGSRPSLDTVVRTLRCKLEGVDGVRRVVAVRGVGFRLLASEQHRPDAERR